MKNIGSKKYSLSWIEFLKGLLMAALVSALMVIQKVADSVLFTGVFVMPDYKVVAMAAISGGCVYLLKKFLTDNAKQNDRV